MFSLFILFSLMTATLGFSYGTPAGIADRTPIPPVVHDTAGHIIRNSTVGQNVIISKNFTNIKDTEVEFTLLIEVRDESGITQFLAWQTGSASPGSTRMMGVSWTPSSAGEYHIRTFPISNLTNPQVLDSVETARFAVLETNQKYGIYGLTIDGRGYAIEYAIPFGSIQEIITEGDAGVISLVFGTVAEDTELTITLPKDLMDEIFLNWVYPLPSGEKSEYIPEFALDTMFVNPISTYKGSDSTTWVIPIEKGSEELDIFVGGPI